MYSYARHQHLPFILRVPSDWHRSNDPAIAGLIIERLERAVAGADPAGSRRKTLKWALANERTIYSTLSIAPTHVPVQRPVPE